MIITRVSLGTLKSRKQPFSSTAALIAEKAKNTEAVSEKVIFLVITLQAGCGKRNKTEKVIFLVINSKQGAEKR